MEFAAVTGAVPPGTARNKKNSELEKIRAHAQSRKLAIQYGVQEATLSRQLGVPPWKAGRILNSHREAYNVYWAWVEDQATDRHEQADTCPPITGGVSPRCG